MKVLMMIFLLMTAQYSWSQTDPKGSSGTDSTKTSTTEEPMKKGDSVEAEKSTSPSWLYLLLPFIGR